MRCRPGMKRETSGRFMCHLGGERVQLSEASSHSLSRSKRQVIWYDPRVTVSGSEDHRILGINNMLQAIQLLCVPIFSIG